MKDSRLLKSLVKFCKFSRNGKDDLQFPEQQVTYLGKTADGFVALPYGVHANIPDGFIGLLFNIYGQDNNRSILPMSPKERPKNLESGDVVFYSPITKEKIWFKASGGIFITGNVTYEDNVTIKGNLTVIGDTTLGATVTSNGKDISDTHTHVGSPSAPDGAQSDTGAPT